MKKGISEYSRTEIKATINEICKNGLSKGCFQDYYLLGLIIAEFYTIVEKGY